MSVSFLLLLFVGGILTGTLGTLLGIGGGLFLIPFLVLLFNIPMHEAIATSIIAVIATSSAGAVLNLQRNIVNIRLGMSLEVASVLGAIFGGITANRLSAFVLTKVFATLLVIVASVLIYRLYHPMKDNNNPTDSELGGRYVDEATGQEISYGVRRIGLTSLVSLLAGNVSGLLGVGGGFFKVPAMHLISGVPLKAAAATSNFMIGVTAAASAFIYFSHGHINPFVAATTSLGVLVGSGLGVRLSKRLKGRVITILFVVVLVAASVQMYWKN